MEKLTTATWSLAVAFLLSGCAAEKEVVGTHRAPIVNGELDSGDPATVFLWLGGGSCSGTLVSPHVVLTARHCLEGVSVSQLSVFFGSDADGPGTWIDAVDLQYHPDGDIGVVAMAQAGPTTPIPMNDRDLAPHSGVPVRIVGFGVTSENGGGSGVKRMGTTELDHVEGEIMYTGFVDQSWTCYGDSGGPNFITFDGVEYVAGVTSFGTTVCGQPADGAVRTDTYIDWLNAYIDEHDPATCVADGRCAAGCTSVDPDCPCATDGFCTAACADLSADVDCAGCGAGDGCREDCPVADADCEPPPGEMPDAGNGDGDGDGDGNPADPPSLVGGCDVGRGAGGAGATWILLLAVGALLIRRRQRLR